MEISNKVITKNFGISKSENKQTKTSSALAFRGSAQKSAQDNGALGKAKIALDGENKKVLSYEEKMELLDSRGFSEDIKRKCLRCTDDVFKEIISYVDIGLSPEEALDFKRYRQKDEFGLLILDLVKNSIPYTWAERVATSRERHGTEYFDDEKIKILKEAKFDFSDDLENFKIDAWELSSIFGDSARSGDEEKYQTFCELHKKGVSGNIIINGIKRGEEVCKNLKKLADIKEIKLSNNTKCAYYLLGVMPSQMEEISGICEKYDLNPDDYNSWSAIAKTRELEATKKLLEAGVPFEAVGMEITLDEKTLKKALEFSKENEVPLSSVITIMQNEGLEVEKQEKSLKYLKSGVVSANIAMDLTNYDDEIAKEIVEYMSAGLNSNNAANLAHWELDKEKKKEILNLVLDKTFQFVSYAKEYVELDLDKKTKEKVLELIKLGACTPLAITCAQDENGYKEALDLVNSGACEDLKEIYAYSIDDFLSSAKLIRLGIPKSNLSLASYGLTDEHKELLAHGVPYETVKKIRDGEIELINSKEVLKLLEKKVDYETACKIYKELNSLGVDFDTLIEVTGEGLNASKIWTLAKIQSSEGKPFKKEDMEIVQAFARRMDKIEELKTIYEYGFLNENALKNFDEIKKRGADKLGDLEIIAVAQIEFKNSEEIDKACELLKKEVASCYIPFLIKDDKAFVKAGKEGSYMSSYSMRNSKFPIYTAKYIEKGLKLEDIIKISKNIFTENELVSLNKFLEKGHNFDDALSIATERFWNARIESDEEKEQLKDLVSDYVFKGCTCKNISEIIADKEKMKKFQDLLNKGIEIKVAEKIVCCDINPNDTKAIEKVRDFCNSNLAEELKKLNSNPQMQSAIEELYNFNNYEFYNFKHLITSDATLEDIKKSAMVFIKSPLKQAMKHPNLYLSNIPSEDTEKIDGKYPELSNEKLQSYQNNMLDFFKFRVPEITKMLKYLDVDTFNQMMDKRTNIFSTNLELLGKMNHEHFRIASEITKCRKLDGKLLSAKEKIDLSKIVLYHQLGYLETDYLESAIKDGKVDVEKLNETIFEKLIEVIGIDPEKIKDIPEEKLDFDKEHMYLLLRTQESADFTIIKDAIGKPEEIEKLKNELKSLLGETDEEIIHQGLTREGCEKLLELTEKMDSMEEKEIYQEFSRISPFAHVDCSIQEAAKIAILEDFETYITKGDNKYALNNSKTEEKFKKLGLNYETWLNYDKKSEITLEGGEYNIKLWDRIPQKDLFMGNRTSCCTAVIDGGNGKATPIYLTNTAFNVVQLKDKNGNIVGMSRIFVGQIDGKPSIVVENIELNNAFLKNKEPEEMKNLRDGMFNYIKGFAKNLSDKDEIKVYFSKNYTHVPTDDYGIKEKQVEFVGDVTSETIYLNCKPGWVKPEELKNETCELYLV